MHAGRREVMEVFLPVFARAVEAGAQGVMSSYNEVDGVPTTSDRWLLTDQLRTAFGFDGYVSSDFGAISGLFKTHHVAANASEAVRMWLEAGGSVNGHDFGANYEKLIVGLVQNDTLDTAILDTAVANVLRVKARLGLVPGVPGYPPLVDARLVQTNLGDNPEHVAIAQRVAEEAVVLLRNEPNYDGTTLPLDPSALQRVVVIGPNADEARTGDYSAGGWAGAAPNGGGPS